MIIDRKYEDKKFLRIYCITSPSFRHKNNKVVCIAERKPILTRKACIVELLLALIFTIPGIERIQVSATKRKTGYEFIWDSMFTQLLILFYYILPVFSSVTP